jgi:hypothetical protein
VRTQANQAAGIGTSGCKAYSDSVHFLGTKGKGWEGESEES